MVDQYPICGEWASQFLSDASDLNPFIAPREFDYSVHVSLKYNYVFLNNPKAACTSIKATLIKAELNDCRLQWPNRMELHGRQHSPLLKASQVYGFKRYLTNNRPTIFCFVRNPYVRLLSAWLDKVSLPTNAKEYLLLSIGQGVRPLDRAISFEDFVDVVCKQKVVEMDSHWRVQYYQTSQANMASSFVGKLENLSDDWVKLREYLRLPSAVNDLTHLAPHATSAAMLLRKYYTASLFRKVREVYALDFEYFQYDVEPPL